MNSVKMEIESEKSNIWEESKAKRESIQTDSVENKSEIHNGIHTEMKIQL